jgi:ankyrin repeat protein
MSEVDIHHEIKENYDQLKKVIAILQANTNFNLAKVTNDNGDIPLHTVMEFGENDVFELVELLVKMNPEGVRTKNKDGNLPLHLHLLGQPTTDGDKVREFLLKEYPEASKVQNKQGSLPIHFAACNDLKTTQLLLKEYPEGIKVEDDNGWLPIHDACSNGHQAIIRLLVTVYPEGLQVAIYRSIKLLLAPRPWRFLSMLFSLTPIQIASR